MPGVLLRKNVIKEFLSGRKYNTSVAPKALLMDYQNNRANLICDKYHLFYLMLKRQLLVASDSYNKFFLN